MVLTYNRKDERQERQERHYSLSAILSNVSFISDNSYRIVPRVCRHSFSGFIPSCIAIASNAGGVPSVSKTVKPAFKISFRCICTAIDNSS